MEIQVNGKSTTIQPGQTVADLLSQLQLVPDRVVIERNREIVPRVQYAMTDLTQGDTLEILHFVGGG